ncbi:hypothetical protein Vafri_18474 [Volvox africanus]|uniref:Uncharacterized protein n=1 Tax=Volvox africanus TaxID=51714 RepID=A0A8J4BSJ0_9CHLO|nr:hypothetical protein Vafri_18474 [Volvox africanus]
MHQRLAPSRTGSCALLSFWACALLGVSATLDTAHASGLKVTIFNDVPAHFEVLAGAVDTVRTHLRTVPEIVWMTPSQNSCSSSDSSRNRSSGIRGRQTTTGRQRSPPFGLLPWLGDAPDNPSWHSFHLCASPNAPSAPKQMQPVLNWGPIDILICISPELDKDTVCHAAARVLRPSLLVALVHRADLIGKGSRFLTDPPAPLHLLALGPHVANTVRARLHNSFPVRWAPLVAAFNPISPCNSRECLRGFAIQGTLRRWSSSKGSGLIRNFSGLWPQLLQPGSAAINLTVLGKGQRRDLEIPASLNHRVKFFSGLPYPDFWQTIYNSYALVPAFGNNQYLKTRISSTVLASLTTCVPMIATREILDVYTFFKEDHVFVQRPGEREVDVMARVIALDDAAIFARRRALCQLRQALGQQAAAMLREALQDVSGSSSAGSSSARTTTVAVAPVHGQGCWLGPGGCNGEPE